MEQNGIRVRFGGNLMRLGSVSSQLDDYVTAVCADKGECGICEFSLDRSHEGSGNEKLHCSGDVSPFSAALFHWTKAQSEGRGDVSRRGRHLAAAVFNLTCRFRIKLPPEAHFRFVLCFLFTKTLP